MPEGRDVGGVGSRVTAVSLWTWPALVAACARDRLCALVLVLGVGPGAVCGPWARHSWCIVARMRKLPLATVTSARVLEPALLRSPRCPARLALLNLGLVELLEVRLDFCCC